MTSDIAALIAEYQDAEQRQRRHDDHMRRIGEKEHEVADLQSRLDAARQVLDFLRETIPEGAANLCDLEAALHHFPDIEP